MAVQAPAQAKPKRTLSPFTLLGLVLAGLGFALVMLLGSLGGGKAGPAAATVDVVVAARDIGLRSSLVKEDLQVAHFAAADAPAAAFTKVDDMKGLVTLVDVKKGQAITSNLLVRSADTVSGPQAAYLPIPSGFVAFTIPTGEQQGVGGYIQAGDYISIVGSVPGPRGSNQRTVFTNVHVLKTGASTGELASADPKAAGAAAAPQRAGGVVSSLTVVLTQCQVEFLNWFINNNATIKYTLESFKDYQPQDNKVDSSCPAVTSARGVTLEDIRSKWPGLIG